jgi:hypothetical protein
MATFKGMMNKVCQPYFIIEWLLPVLTLAYSDFILALFLVFFGSPALAILFAFSYFLVRRAGYSKRLIYTLRSISIVSALLLTYFFIQTYSAENQFKSHFIDPIPTSVSNIETGGTLNVWGISSFYITFSIASQDFDSILKSRQFYQDDIENLKGRKPHLYKEAFEEAKQWIDNPSEIYIDDDERSKYRCWVLVTNKDHNQIYYKIY